MDQKKHLNIERKGQKRELARSYVVCSLPIDEEEQLVPYDRPTQCATVLAALIRPSSEERLPDIVFEPLGCVSGSDSDRCHENAMDHEYQNVFYHSVAHR